MLIVLPTGESILDSWVFLESSETTTRGVTISLPRKNWVFYQLNFTFKNTKDIDLETEYYFIKNLLDQDLKNIEIF